MLRKKSMSTVFGRQSISGLIFDIFNIFVMAALCISMLYPFLHVLSLSLSPPESSSVIVPLIPREVTFSNYQKVLASSALIQSLFNTLHRTILGSFLSLIAVICTAYPLAKRYFPNRNFWTAFIVFTMFFGGGLIPSYMLVRNLGLLNNRMALILPGLIPSFNMIIMRNFFMALPESLEESAKIDGANDMYILYKIVLPISKPIIATVSLWLAVGHWNAWFDSLLYVPDISKQVLQVLLRNVILASSERALGIPKEDPMTLRPETMKAATIMVASVPIIAVYPFAQKYFVKGIMVGSLKG